MKLSAKTGHLESTTDTIRIQDKSQDPKENWNQLKSNSPPPTQKKSKGVLDFINQKLHQWPLWNKIFSSQASTENAKTTSPIIHQTQINKFHLKNHIRVLKISELPWNIFFSRGHIKQVYQYYHCKEDNMTYFYTASPGSREIVGYEIFVPPQIKIHYMRNAFVIPSQIATPLIEREKIRGICK